jgi:hypothetical protein
MPPPLAQQELEDPMTPPQEILRGIFMAAYQVPKGFLLGGRNKNGCQFSSSIHPGQLLGVSPIILHTISGLSRYQRRGDHLTIDSPALQKATHVIPARPGLIDTARLPHTRKPLCQLPQRFRRIGNRQPGFDITVIVKNRNVDILFMDIHPRPYDRIIHDRLLLYVALASGPVPNANPRSYTLSRSIHNVYRLEEVSLLTADGLQFPERHYLDDFFNLKGTN